VVDGVPRDIHVPDEHHFQDNEVVNVGQNEKLPKR
jgi:hypothetical protein